MIKVNWIINLEHVVPRFNIPATDTMAVLLDKL